ncbi:MAG: class I SAM-dependent methyltransferase [Erythrobacter sp.]
MAALIADPANAKSLAYRFRSKRDKLLRSFLEQARPPGNAPCRVVDLGGGSAYWERVGFQWLEANGFEVTCINYDSSELTRDITASGRISLIVGDACDLQEFEDDSFDIVHSNSVIEHVGGWTKMSSFAKEARRLAPAYYVQTPNFWFPVDPHFYRVPMIHWLPPSARASVHRKVRAGWSGPA